MCFVKNLLHKKVTFQSAFKPCDSRSKYSIQEESKTGGEVQEPQSQLVDLFKNLLFANSMVMSEISSSLNDIFSKLEEAQIEVKQIQQEEQKSEITGEISSVDPEILQIFGEKTYQFELRLSQKIPDILYKERNFSCQLNLIDSKGVPVRNANIIPLCLGVCTTNGEWVQENKAGQSIIKGKTEIDMYQGCGQFQKIYMREVSRPYPQGKFHLIVYPKPSTIKYTTHTTLEQNVSWQSIKPLLIKDICVRAKKK